MSYITKHGAFRKQMTKRTSVESMVYTSKSVPKKFIETEGRKRFQRIVSVLELNVFGVTVLIVGFILLFMTFPKLLPESLSELEISLVIIPLFLVNILGMFISSASNGVEANWCARGLGVMFACLGTGFVLNSILRTIF